MNGCWIITCAAMPQDGFVEKEVIRGVYGKGASLVFAGPGSAPQYNHAQIQQARGMLPPTLLFTLGRGPGFLQACIVFARACIGVASSSRHLHLSLSGTGASAIACCFVWYSYGVLLADGTFFHQLDQRTKEKKSVTKHANKKLRYASAPASLMSFQNLASEHS